MESIRGDYILLRDFVPSLSENAVLVLQKKLDALESQRKLSLKMTRQGTMSFKASDIASDNPASTASKLVSGDDGADHKSTYFSNLSDNSQSTSTVDKKSLNVRQQTLLMLDSSVVDDVECITFAAQTIQNMARGSRDRALAQRKKDDLLNSRMNSAMTQGEFVLLTGEILRNTIFNLMQEAVYDEFPVTAEPLKFVMKKSETVIRDHSIDNSE